MIDPAAAAPQIIVPTVTGYPALDEIMKQGLLGAITIVVGYFCWQLYKALIVEKDARRTDRDEFNKLLVAERDARLADARVYAGSLLEVNTKVITATNTLSDTADKILASKAKS